MAEAEGEQQVSQPAKLQPCGPGEVGAAVRRALSSQTIVICINHIARGVHGVKVFKCLQGWVLVDYMLSLREVVIIVQCRLLHYLLFTYDDLHCVVFFLWKRAVIEEREGCDKLGGLLPE